MRKVIAILACALFSMNAAFGFDNIVEARIKGGINNLQTASANKQSNNGAQFFNKHSLLLIYSSRCRYCHLFAPTLKQYVDERGLTVRSISLDGRPIRHFPNIEQADEALINTAYGDMPHGTPALFVINEETNAIYPVLFGNASYDELSNRVMTLILKIKDFEGGA